MGPPGNETQDNTTQHAHTRTGRDTWVTKAMSVGCRGEESTLFVKERHVMRLCCDV
jgi:hypothetical protein